MNLYDFRWNPSRRHLKSIVSRRCSRSRWWWWSSEHGCVDRPAAVHCRFHGSVVACLGLVILSVSADEAHPKTPSPDLVIRVTGGIFNPAVSTALLLIDAIGPVRWALCCFAQVCGRLSCHRRRIEIPADDWCHRCIRCAIGTSSWTSRSQYDSGSWREQDSSCVHRDVPYRCCTYAIPSNFGTNLRHPLYT